MPQLNSTAEDPEQKKKRSTDLLRRPPRTLANVMFVGTIPDHVFFATIASFGWLDLRDLLILSMVSRSFYYTMDHAYWERILKAPMFEPLYQARSFVKLKPRHRAVRRIMTSTCPHCRELQPNEIKRRRYEPQACPKCILLPQNQVIQYSEAVAMWCLSPDQIDKIPTKTLFIKGRYRQCIKLNDVMELVEQERLERERQSTDEHYFLELCRMLADSMHGNIAHV
ncbi:hypothetical protein AC1031_004228 [Aphanomyces cochlioides]|nr:hypothetical protein AC1031_004228 [Aphanomyces cochlioides]